ncbi:aldose 1-epimerase family protein [Jannaschia sp. Os4]|uniref:aldose 1-epimerase family protein n=1 Tax=Jannaschia sp. Os4 TaxID=2807617 RepID=UPI00193A492F|nr:aldose 1-epimerase family protein [Jannaschia sp. Os4]MBM2575253.1 aldose 1-epimerase family protein [Jannaschia sp. Os4]
MSDPAPFDPAPFDTAKSGTRDPRVSIRLVTCAEGMERGARLLLLRAGPMEAEIAVDRALDVLALRHAGREIGWHSPTGLVAPALLHPEEEGMGGWLRGFTGLLATCGLDHAMGPAEGDARPYGDPRRTTRALPLHGRVATLPATLTGHGIDWADGPTLWAEGNVRQAAVFGEHLELRRRIELRGTRLSITDTVENLGFAPTPHQMLYHVNLGWPLLDEGARIDVEGEGIAWTAHDGDPDWRAVPAPAPDRPEWVWQHRAPGPSATVTNEALGLSVRLTHDLPHLLQWGCYRSGLYALGLEPGTHPAPPLRAEGDADLLGHGDTRTHHVAVEVLDAADALVPPGGAR